jgi:hypothetical protein
MNYKTLINRILAADDLHYDEREKRYVSIAPDEVEKIAAKCRKRGLTDDDLIKQYVRWYAEVRVGLLLHRSFLRGHIRITGFDGGQPRFAPRSMTE